jgi:hypothetical protein
MLRETVALGKLMSKWAREKIVLGVQSPEGWRMEKK